MKKAKNKYLEFDVSEADKYIKRLFPNADYMAIEKRYVMVLEQSNKRHDPSVDYRYFDIDGKQYESTYTNDYEYLKKSYKEKSFEQLTLF